MCERTQTFHLCFNIPNTQRQIPYPNITRLIPTYHAILNSFHALPWLLATYKRYLFCQQRKGDLLRGSEVVWTELPTGTDPGVRTLAFLEEWPAITLVLWTEGTLISGKNLRICLIQCSICDLSCLFGWIHAVGFSYEMLFLFFWLWTLLSWFYVCLLFERNSRIRVVWHSMFTCRFTICCPLPEILKQWFCHLEPIWSVAVCRTRLKIPNVKLFFSAI